MAKNKKSVIDARIEKLKSLGYESVQNSQGDYQTTREDDRMFVTRKAIEYMGEEEWSDVMESVEADHTKHLPLTETEVIEPEAAEPASTEVSTIDVKMKNELKAFENNPLVKAIAEFEQKYKGLTFTGLEDKPGIEALRAAKKTVQKTRTFVTKHEETLKAPYLSHLNEIRSISKKYQAMIAPIEDPLDVELDRLKTLETEEEDRKTREAEQEGTRRVEVLKENGMKFDGQFYVIGETMSMDYASLKAMTAKDFEKFAGKVAAEKKRLDDLEAAELEQLKANRRSTRGNMLLSIGMVYAEIDNEGNYTSEHLYGVKVTTECLTDEPDDKFMTLFSSLTTRINDAKTKAKEEADRKAKERTVALRSKLLLSIGMERVDWIPGSTQTGFLFKNEFADCAMILPWVESASDEEFDKQLEDFEATIKSAKESAKNKEEEEAKSRQLASDRHQQLIGMGLIAANQLSAYVFNLPDSTIHCSVSFGELTGKSPEAWEEVIKEVTELVQAIKDQQKAIDDKREQDKKDREEKEAKEAMIFQERSYRLLNLGLVIVGDSFLVKNEYNDVATISIAEVKATDEDMWPAKLVKVTEAVEEVKKLTTDKRKAEADKAETMKPEIQRAEELVTKVWEAIKETSSSQFNDEEVAQAYGLFYDAIYKAVNLSMGRLTELKNK